MIGNGGGDGVGRQWRTTVVACLGIAVALVAGCSQGTESRNSRSLPTASSAQPSSTLPPLGPADFPVPDKARTRDAPGAEAALRYYLDLVAHQNGKGGKPLRELSQSCDLCTFLANRNDEDAAAGYVVQGGEATVLYMSSPAIHEGTAEFAINISQSKVTVRDRAGNPVAGRGSEAIPQLRGGAILTWSDSSHSWIVTQLTFQQS